VRVQATKQGFYNQFLHEAGEVFDLLDNEDGTMPLRMKQKKVDDVFPPSHPQAGKPTFHWEDTEEPELDAEGNPLHRDFAPDGPEYIGTTHGFKGDVFRFGWMRVVPDDTQLGIYPPEITFGTRGQEQRSPIARVVRPSNEPVNAPRSAPIRGKIDRTVRQGG
jgi:hypothetical protein